MKSNNMKMIIQFNGLYLMMSSLPNLRNFLKMERKIMILVIHLFSKLSYFLWFKYHIKFLTFKNSWCGVKSRKCVKIEGKKNFTWLIFLTSNNFESKKKRVSRFGQATSFLKKSKKKAHVRGILLIPHLCTNNEFSIVFDPLENLTGQGNIGVSQRYMVSYG